MEFTLTSRKTAKLLAAILLMATVSLYFANRSKKMNGILKVGFPAYWGMLVPSLQHTGYADAIMANQYEALVTSGVGGVTEPLAAKEWTISEDFKVFTFTIDTTRRFSNGKYLTARDFKRSWEYGIKLDPKSSNSSLLDVMYKIEGYEEFAITGDLKGLSVVDDNILKIRFKKPFRMALNHLSGSRMSAFVKDDSRYLGTGPYVIDEVDKKLLLSKNKFSSHDIGYEQVQIEVVLPEKAEQSLKDSSISVYMMAEFANIRSCLDDSSDLKCYSGSEAAHQVVIINGLKGRVFDKVENRLAVQALVYKNLSTKILPDKHKSNLTIDPQIYLPMQIGRIEGTVSTEIVKRGEAYISDFILESKKNPIYLVTSGKTNWIQEILEKEGVVFSKKSGWVKTQDRIKMYYKTHEADMFVGSFSVASGDPDGIYHALGRNGSIGSPLMFRKQVGDLLEQGREVLDMAIADKIYQEVSRTVLKEVPFIHLGFTKTIVAYRKDKVHVQQKHKKRDDNRLSIYEPI